MPKPSFGRLAGRGKAGGRRRDDDTPPPATAAPADPDTTDDGADDQELSSYLKALAPENDVESTGSGRRFGDAQVYQLRMTHAAGEQLSEVAAERGTSPQALALEWVLERLAWEAGPAPQDAAPQQAQQPAPPQTSAPQPPQHPQQPAGQQPVGQQPMSPQGAAGTQTPPEPRPEEHTDPRQRAVPPHGVPAEENTDEHFFDRTGWAEPNR